MLYVVLRKYLAPASGLGTPEHIEWGGCLCIFSDEIRLIVGIVKGFFRYAEQQIAQHQYQHHLNVESYLNHFDFTHDSHSNI